MIMYSEHMVSSISATLEPRISILDFVSQLQDKIQDGKHGFEAISQHGLFPSTVFDKYLIDSYISETYHLLEETHCI